MTYTTKYDSMGWWYVYKGDEVMATIKDETVAKDFCGWLNSRED